MVPVEVADDELAEAELLPSPPPGAAVVREPDGEGGDGEGTNVLTQWLAAVRPVAPLVVVPAAQGWQLDEPVADENVSMGHGVSAVAATEETKEPAAAGVQLLWPVLLEYEPTEQGISAVAAVPPTKLPALAGTHAVWPVALW